MSQLLSLSTAERHELIELVRIGDDDVATSEQVARLEELILNHQDGRLVYKKAISCISSLHWLLAEDREATAKLSQPMRDQLATDEASPGLSRLGNRLTNELKPATVTRSLAFRIPGSFLRSRTGSLLLATFVVAICLYGSFVIVAWNMRPDKLSSFAPDSSDFVAMVRDSADVRWSQNAASKSAEASILSGEPLKIESGTIELELNAGTKLVVEGPAEWSVDGRNSVSLRAGKLWARVPEQAIGFTVETPTATIVDRGTEFGVEANPDGTTAVKVVQGNVTLATNNENQDNAKQSITLKAGEARKVFREDHSRKWGIGEIAPSSVRIPQQRAASGPRRIMVQGTMESSSRGSACTAIRLIDGSGMHGNCHSSLPDEGMSLGAFNMWITPFGKVRNEFVLFDLGLEYRLHSMKVWNFNDGRHNLHLARGLKQADIYVSTSGRGSPLSDPKDWKLVAENHMFPPASGTADYDTPEVLEFDRIRARFVAIVVDDHFGPDPGQPEVCVGLSEVQFFGDRTTTP